MRISTDGFIDIRTHTKVRTPGFYEVKMTPCPKRRHGFPPFPQLPRPPADRPPSHSPGTNEAEEGLLGRFRERANDPGGPGLAGHHHTGSLPPRSGRTGVGPGRQGGGGVGLSNLPGWGGNPGHAHGRASPRGVEEEAGRPPHGSQRSEGELNNGCLLSPPRKSPGALSSPGPFPFPLGSSTGL